MTEQTKSEELYETLSDLWKEFEENHNSTTKVSARRARKALGKIKKLVTDYRRYSVEENR